MVDMGILVGSIRRFGLEGPPYEVVGPAALSETGEAQMRIHLFESDEDVDYPVSDILRDPEAD
jgi:Family of unknown function (DUF5397)